MRPLAGVADALLTADTRYKTIADNAPFDLAGFQECVACPEKLRPRPNPEAEKPRVWPKSA